MLKLRRLRGELQLVGRLLLLARGSLWFLPAMAGLAVLSAMFEGLSLILIIPLVHLLGGTTAPASRFAPIGWLRHMFETLPSDARLPAILGAIMAAVLIKGAVSYGNYAVLGVVYGRLSHRLRIGIF